MVEAFVDHHILQGKRLSLSKGFRDTNGKGDWRRRPGRVQIAIFAIRESDHQTGIV